MKTNKPGRPFVATHLKRNKMAGVRIQQWMLDWLRNQPVSGGRIIEKLLLTIIPTAEVKNDK